MVMGRGGADRQLDRQKRHSEGVAAGGGRNLEIGVITGGWRCLCCVRIKCCRMGGWMDRQTAFHVKTQKQDHEVDFHLFLVAGVCVP